MKLLLYCTKAKPYLYGMYSGFESRYGYHLTNDKNVTKEHSILNGKIVAECDFEVEEISSDFHADYDYSIYDYVEFKTSTISNLELEKRSCVDYEEMCEYLGYYEEDKEKVGYAIHIKNLHIFDEPRELRDYTTRKVREWDSIVCDSCTDFGFDCKKCSYYYEYQEVDKAPQNMMKVCEWDVKDNILISIRPEWLCKILNGEKTIEVRKKVLKEMLG